MELRGDQDMQIRAVGIWSTICQFYHRGAGVDKFARGRIISLAMLVIAPLCVPQERALANVVSVTITGVLTSGADKTGLFGQPTDNLSNRTFNLFMSINDMNGKSCGVDYSCIDQSPNPAFGLPMKVVMLSVLPVPVNGVTPSATPFLYGSYPGSITQQASHELNHLGHPAYLSFGVTEIDAPTQAEPHSPGGSAQLYASLYLDELLSPCWEGAVPSLTLDADEIITPSGLTNTFTINLVETDSSGKQAVKFAKGALEIRTISITPVPNPPPGPCFVLNSPAR
jgi:hypothetical protein